jgi:hypothetical protein
LRVTPAIAKRVSAALSGMLKPGVVVRTGEDGVLGRSGVNVPRLIHALRMQAKRGKLTIAGKERGAIVWPGDVAAP